MPTATISLKPEQEQQTKSLNRVLSLLLQGLALQSYCQDDAEFQFFQAKIRNLREEIAKIDEDSAGLPETGGTDMRPADRGDGVEVTPRQKDLQAAIFMISESLLSIARSPESQANVLRQSQYDVVTAKTGEEIASAAARLSVCLDGIKMQILRKEDSVLAPSQHYNPTEIDSVTGLPDARQALDALSVAWKHRKKYCASVFGVRRLDAINARFGFHAGDDVMRVVSQHLAEHFGRDFLLFRWRGPCILSVMEKKLPLPLMSAEVKRVAGMRLEQAVTMRNREAIVAIALSCDIISLETNSVDDVISRLEEFITKQVFEK